MNDIQRTRASKKRVRKKAESARNSLYRPRPDSPNQYLNRQKKRQKINKKIILKKRRLTEISARARQRAAR